MQNVPIQSVRGNDRNPRKLDKEKFQKLVQSIKDFPEMLQKRPLIVADGVILGGNMRHKAAIEAGLKEIPIIDASEWTEEQRKQFIIKDNLSFGEWDWDVLANEWDAAELEEWGLDVWTPDEPTEGLTDPDDVPSVPEEPTTQPGDLWLLGDHRLLCGDSTYAPSVKKLMDGKKADMVFTDPPYGVDYEGINNDDKEGLPLLLRHSFHEMKNATKEGGGVYVFHSDRCADIFNTVFREKFHFSSMLIWAKNRLVLSQTDYQSQHEPCLYGWVEGAPHRFYGDRKQVSVWQFDKESIAGHTTPKPVDLVCRAINNSSQKGQVVLDLFLGSGSTLIAAEKTGRTCYGMELDPKYCDVIVKRWEDFTGKKAQRV